MKRILVPIDFSATTDRALAMASELAGHCGGAVILLHVGAPDPDFVGLDVGPQTVRDQEARHLKEEHAELAAAVKRVAATPGISVESHMVRGATVDTIVERAEQYDVDLIVIGSHGKGAIKRMLLGSVSEGVLRGSRRPVLVVPSSDDAA